MRPAATDRTEAAHKDKAKGSSLYHYCNYPRVFACLRVFAVRLRHKLSGSGARRACPKNTHAGALDGVL